MPVRNIGEGSKPQGFVTRLLRADSRERPALKADRALHGSLNLPGLKAGVSRGESDE